MSDCSKYNNDCKVYLSPIKMRQEIADLISSNDDIGIKELIEKGLLIPIYPETEEELRDKISDGAIKMSLDEFFKKMAE